MQSREVHMHRLTGIFTLLFLFLTLISPSSASSQTSGLTNDDASLTQNRLVVFEAFMRST